MNQSSMTEGIFKDIESIELASTSVLQWLWLWIHVHEVVSSNPT